MEFCLQERRQLGEDDDVQKCSVARVEEINSLIARFICSEVLSFDMVESDAFRL